MQPITAPVDRDSPRQTVANLQDGLRALLRGGEFGFDDDRVREFDERLTEEAGRYGDGTEQLVGLFQERRQLPFSGRVDGPTAAALNTVLRAAGLLDDPAAPGRPMLVTGRVVRDDGTAIRGVTVRVAHDGDPAPIRLGTDITDDDGRYTVEYLPPDGVFVTLRVSAVDADGIVLAASGAIGQPAGVQVVDLVADFRTPADTARRVRGHVVLDHGAPADNLTVRLYRRDFGGGSTLLAETSTREAGRYSLGYDGAAPGGVELRAVDAQGVEVTLSSTLHDTNRLAEPLVLVAPTRLQAPRPEFRRLADEVGTHVGGDLTALASAKENVERQDLTLLNRATGWDARLLALASNAAVLSTDPDVGLGHEAVYGLLRAGLPSDKLQLARVSATAVTQALTAARDAGVVGLSDADITAATSAFAGFARTTGLSVRAPGSHSSYGELLAATDLDEGTRTRFADAFLANRGGATDLWDAAFAAGLTKPQVTTLRRQGKLAFLTANSAPVTARVQQLLGDAEPEALVGLKLYDAAEWAAQLRAEANDDPARLAALIPPAYQGDTVEARLAAYCADLARKIKLSYPTQVLSHQLDGDADGTVFGLGDAGGHTAAALRTAMGAGFRLGEVPVESFLTERPDVLAGEAEPVAAAQGLRALQRVYQLTPSHEAVPVLMKHGITSAYDVVGLSRSVFVERFGHHFPSKPEAELVYRKAQQISSVTYNLFTIASTLDATAMLPALTGPVASRTVARNQLIKQFPTMESMLGSMDYAECEHCRSVLSPAAYLVDLLQFVDPETALWRNFLDSWAARHGGEAYTDNYTKPYDALVARRPDLPHIALTCENTETVLPYIDLVNEILEYYVAHGTLTAAAAQDTGSASTEELLAEPRTVLAEAYAKLDTARYPLGLPFDLWLATVRAFCRFSETPLWTVLDALRPTEELFAVDSPYDRAAVFVESIGITPAEYAIFTDPAPLDAWFGLYGYASEPDALQPAEDAVTGQRIDLNSAKALSRRLGVSYRRLAELVDSRFVNQGLAGLKVLRTLGLTVNDVLTYDADRAFFTANADLLGADRDSLPAEAEVRWDAMSTADWTRLTDAAGVVERLAALTARYRDIGFDAAAWLDQALADDAFDQVLVFADDEPDGGFDRTLLRYADGRPIDAIALLRINLLTRLVDRLGWSVADVDRAVVAFMPADTPFDAAHLADEPLRGVLVQLAHLAALAELLPGGTRRRQALLTLWTDLPTAGTDPLYARLLLADSVLRVDGVFDDPLGRYLSPAAVTAAAAAHPFEVSVGGVSPVDALEPAAFVAHPRLTVAYEPVRAVQRLVHIGPLSDVDRDAIAALSASPVLPGLLAAVQARVAEFGLVNGHLVALQGALGLSADDIAVILTDATPDPASAELSVATVSVLHRYGLLAGSLGLSVRELVVLMQLSGVDPFDTPFDGTLRFVEITALVRQSGLTVADLDHLLRHEFDPAGSLRPDPVAALATIGAVADGVRAIRAEHPVPAPGETVEPDLLARKLGLVFAPEVVERFLGMIAGTAEFTVAAPATPADRLDPALRADPAVAALIADVRYDETRQQQRLTVRGVLTAAQRADLRARVPAPLFGTLLDAAAAQERAFFDGTLRLQKLRLDDETGFLDDADYDVLFAPSRPPVAITATDSPEQVAAKTAQNEAIAAANADNLRDRHHRVAVAFLPLLRRRLIRAFVVQTVAGLGTADAALVAGLVTDERLLSVPSADGNPDGTARSLLAVLADTGTGGLTGRFHLTQDATGPARTTATADIAVIDGSGSARFDGYLQVPTAGAYRFTATLGAAGAAVELRFADRVDPVLLSATAGAPNAEHSVFLELAAGRPHRVSVLFTGLAGAGAALTVQGETLPRGGLDRLVLRPAEAVDAAADALLLLGKALRVIEATALTERELRHLLTHPADFDGLSLAALPTRRDPDPAVGTATAQVLFGQLLRLLGYAALREEVAGGTDGLIDVFTAPTADAAWAAFGTLTRRDVEVVAAAARALPGPVGYADERAVGRLWQVLRLVQRLGVPVTTVAGLTAIVSPAASARQRAGIARDLKDAVRARFDHETWLSVAKSVFDPLRQQRRDALVGYVMQFGGFASVEQLYEYFLVDPGMEPVVQTSRIRLASSSVQLFVQRCLLNLEPHVHPSVIDPDKWDNIKQYRPWEAARKIFLYPENWLEGEFRDDKTPPFTELEGKLLAGDVNPDVVEDAFLGYLRALEEVARLDVVAMHLDDHGDPARNTLHVIGRSFGRSGAFFHRTNSNRTWSPWRPIDAEIAGNHIAPVVWRDRLYVFWVTFVDRMAHTDQPSAPGGSGSGKTTVSAGISSPYKTELLGDGADTTAVTDMSLSHLTRGALAASPDKVLLAQLHWTEYLHGEWSTHSSADFADSMVVRVKPTFDPNTVPIHVSKEYEDGEERGVLIHLGGTVGSSFYLAGRNSRPQGRPYQPSPANPYSAATVQATKLSGKNGLNVAFSQRLTTDAAGKSTVVTASPAILNKGGSYTLLPCDNSITLGDAEVSALVKPVFYQDSRNTFYLEPELTERRLQDWQEWVTPAPQAEHEWDRPSWWKEALIAAATPKVSIAPSTKFSEESLHTKVSELDWVVNPHTGVLLDGELIGPAGRISAGELTGADTVAALAGGGTEIGTTAGSGIGAGSALVATGHAALASAGLAQDGRGLNVIGGSGFNAALKRTLGGTA